MKELTPLPIHPDESLTTQEAARFLRIDDQQLLRYTKLGLIDHIEGMGKGFRYTVPALIALRERFLVKALPTSPAVHRPCIGKKGELIGI